MEMNGTTVIKQPVDTVFAYVIDLANDANWRSGLTESGLRPGETLGVGAVGYSRAGEQEVGWQVVTYDPPNDVAWDLTSGPLQGRGGYSMQSVPEGTRFTLVADIEPAGVYKLLPKPVFRWFGRRQNQADVEKLKAILESA